MEPILIVALILIILWTFWSGFTDAANSISTIVGTRVLSPLNAVMLAAAGNFVGVLFGSAVAITLGKGIINPEIISAKLIIGALLGGFIWEFITYYRGIPISKSQVLVGTLVGAALAAVGTNAVFFSNIFKKVLIPMSLAPFVAFVFTYLFTALIINLFYKQPATLMNKRFRWMQIFSSFFFSVSHGANDAMKSAGIFWGVLVYYSLVSGNAVPTWILYVSVTALSLGTLFGGWRIVRTMGVKITALKPFQGFCAEASASIIVAVASVLGFPLSTTQTVSGAIIGSGAYRNVSAVRWGVVREVLFGWILTIPISALLAYMMYNVLNLVI